VGQEVSPLVVGCLLPQISQRSKRRPRLPHAGEIRDAVAFSLAGGDPREVSRFLRPDAMQSL
jgi:hypothetical protein